MITYMLTDGQDNQLCDGLSELRYARVAQEDANRLGHAIYAWSSEEGAEPEEFLPTAELADAKNT